LALAEFLSRREELSLVLADVVAEDQWDDCLAAVAGRGNVEYCRVDLTDPHVGRMLPRDIDTIFHLAGVLGVEQVQRSPDRVLEVNAVSTLNVFNYARTLTGLMRVVFSSTSEVYAGTLRHMGVPIPTPETVPLCLEDVSAPRTSYALSKMYGEGVAFAWRQCHGIPTTILRYHNVYGPRMGMRHVIPETFVKIARSDGTINVPSARHTRAFCFIEDGVEATIRCAEAAQTEGQIVHVGSSREEIEIRDLVSKIAEVMNRRIAIRELPDTPGSPSRRCPNVTALERLTGFRAMVSLDDGLCRTYAWYRERLGMR
jgi:nucleoside-diphosphate-sugar epimerase